MGSNHAVSGLKFKILRPILDMGYAVLLSDVDIVTLQNPFDHLYRDCDVEGMSDGWDNATAYGGTLSWFHDYTFIPMPLASSLECGLGPCASAVCLRTVKFG